MAADTTGAGNTVRLQGFDDLAAKLRAIVPALRKRVLRNALAAGARVVRDDAKRAAPVLQRAAPYRTAGTVRKAITVRTSKFARRNGDVGVFVNVRPAKGAAFKGGVQTRASQRGAKSKIDPFYWRFLEFGTRKMSKKPFLQPAAKRLPDALAVFQLAVGKWIAKTNQTGKVEA